MLLEDEGEEEEKCSAGCVLILIKKFMNEFWTPR